MSAILDHTNGVVASFMRGSDMPGSIQGAGGVGLPRHSEATAGGVLAVNFGLSTFNSQPSTHCVSYDGNGNVVALHNAADGVESAAYEYGPFSEPIRVTGPLASLMPLRFSTMFEDSVTGDRKYLFRDYTPSIGRWKSRDPIHEVGFESIRSGKARLASRLPIRMREAGNLQVFLRNNSLNDIDLFGLCEPPPTAPSCECGKDVTSQVFLTLQDIADTFANANAFRRWEATWSMFGILSFASWDIRYLYDYYDYVNPFPVIPGCEVCDKSVTFQGMCVRPNELNYIMYGWGMQITDYPRTPALLQLASGLAIRGADDPQAALRKLAFASYGSDLSHNLPSWAAFPSTPQCQPVTKKSNFDIHHWRWMGLKWTGW